MIEIIIANRKSEWYSNCKSDSIYTCKPDLELELQIRLKLEMQIGLNVYWIATTIVKFRVDDGTET